MFYGQSIAVLKYNGGGDWYANPSSLTNLIAYANQHLSFQIDSDYKVVSPLDEELIQFPFLHLTGHGNIVLNTSEVNQIRNYLISGGFLHIDDNYGIDTYVRTVIKELFPNLPLVEIPFQHPIYQYPFQFTDGLPKVHEHDGKSPQGFGIFYEGRLVLFYTYECDLGDGWEDPSVHNDPEYIRELSLQMGVNILHYAFTGGLSSSRK